jgi:hypothetical protein
VVCRLLIGIFGLIYVLALALFLIGTVGLFGADPDPLSGVYLIPLGLPWVRMVDVFPEPMWPFLGVACPAINLALLWILCRFLRRVRS